MNNINVTHEIEKVEIRRQQHVAEHVKEVSALQQHNNVLEQNNAQLQKLIDDHTIRLKHLENNSKYVELNSKLQHEEERCKELFLEKEAIISNKVALHQEMLDLNNQLNLMHLEIKKVKDYHKEEINHHRLLVEKREK